MLRLAVVAAALLSACAAARPVVRAGQRVGQPMDLAAADLSGLRVDVAADRGKVRVVEFWASWCEPCRDAFPFLDALLAERGGDGLAVYAVSFDEDPAQVRLFLEQVPVRFTVLWDKGGERLGAPYDVRRLPTSFLVDRKGIVRFVHEGYDEAIAGEMRRQVEALLAEP